MRTRSGFATLSDVARHAHVSPSTASKVIRGAPGVSPDLRTLVLASAAALDYRPSADGRALKAGGATGWVTMAVPSLSRAYYARLAAALLRVTHTHGLPTALVETGGDPAVERRLLTEGPENSGGLLLAMKGEPPVVPVGAGGPATVLLVDLEGPCVFDRVSVDSAAATALCTNHLLARGRVRPALVGAQGTLSHASARQRERGFREALRQKDTGIPFRGRALPSWSAEQGERAVLELLTEDPAIDAVVAANDEAAFGVLRGLHRLGLRVPDDVAVTGIDDVDYAAHSSPPLTTVTLPAAEMAEAAIDLLLRRFADPTSPPRAVTVSGRLVLRSSS